MCGTGGVGERRPKVVPGPAMGEAGEGENAMAGQEKSFPVTLKAPVWTME